MNNIKTTRRKKIHKKIRKNIFGTAEIPRLSVYKSNKNIYCQLINDHKSHTLVSSSSLKIVQKNKNTTQIIAKEVGKILAKQAKKQGIIQIVFDRSGYLYHGQVKSIAEGVREQGIKF